MKLRTLLFVACTILALGYTVLARQAGQAPARSTERIAKEVRHELLMLPYLGVFDNLGYKVDGYNVTLAGQVTRPTWTTAFAVSFTAPSTATRRCRNMPWECSSRSASLSRAGKSLSKAWWTARLIRTSPIFGRTVCPEFSLSPTISRL